MKPWHWLLAAAGLPLSYATSAEACAGCRNPSMAVGRSTEGPVDEGALRASAMITATAVHVIHEAGCVDPTDPSTCTDASLQPRYLHDQHLYPVELRLMAEYSFNQNFGVEVQLPFRMVKTSIEYTTLAGAPYQPLDAGVHHRDETVAGLADPWLLFKAGTTLGKWWLAARPGVSLPLGVTREDPFELGDQGLRHQHIQFGTGTFDPVLVLEAFHQLDSLKLAFFAQSQISLYENSHGYQAPWKIYGGASVGTTLVGDLSGSIGPEAFHEGEEKWQGVVRQDGSLGRTEILANVALTQRVDATDFNLGVRVPLWRNIVEGSEALGKLTSPLTVYFGVSHEFGAGAEPANDEVKPADAEVREDDHDHANN